LLSFGISGKVSDAAGTGIANVFVAVYKNTSPGMPLQSINGTNTDANGNYFIAIPNGSYKVQFKRDTCNMVCSNSCVFTCEPDYTPLWNGGYDKNQDTTAPVVVAAQETTVVNATLLRPGISGKVSNSEGAGIANIWVTVYQNTPPGAPLQLISSINTDANGNYFIKLPSGSYKVKFSVGASVCSINTTCISYNTLWYGGYDKTQDTTPAVVVVEPNTTSVNAMLLKFGISGKVSNASGFGIANANVDVFGYTVDGIYSIQATQTDANGIYFINLPNGNYKVQFRPNSNDYVPLWNGGYDRTQETTTTVVVADPNTTVVNATLLKFGITGRVSNSLGVDFAYTWVYVYKNTPPGVPLQQVASAYTDASGNYFIILPNGSYKIQFSSGFYVLLWNGGYDKNQDTTTPVIVTAPATTTVNATLLQFGIRGKVINSSGIGIANAWIAVFPNTPPGVPQGPLYYGATDTSGNYQINLPSGSYKVQFTAPNFRSLWHGGYDKTQDTTIPLTVTAPAITTVNATLLQIGISGKVSTAGGAGISGTWVYVFKNTPAGAPLELVDSSPTFPDGSYSINVPAGSYKVVFYAPNYMYLWNGGYDKNQDTTTPVIVTDPNVTIVNAILRQFGIAGKVRDASGAGLAGASVNVYQNTPAGADLQMLASAYTDSDGNYSIMLSGGSYKVEMIAPGYLPLWNGGYDKTVDTTTLAVVTPPDSATVNGTLFQHLLAVTLSGSGGGTVYSTSDATGIPSDISCTSGTCIAGYLNAGQVDLSVLADGVSTFSTWEGACTSSPCSVSVNGAKSVTATFTLAPLVKNATTGLPYPTLAEAVTKADSGAELHLLDTHIDETGSLNKTLVVQGGWKATYESQSGTQTLLHGALTVLSGDSSVERLDIKGILTIRGGSLRVSGVTVK
jgi:hypothetical protein